MQECRDDLLGARNDGYIGMTSLDLLTRIMQEESLCKRLGTAIVLMPSLLHMVNTFPAMVEEATRQVEQTRFADLTSVARMLGTIYTNSNKHFMSFEITLPSFQNDSTYNIKYRNSVPLLTITDSLLNPGDSWAFTFKTCVTPVPIGTEPEESGDDDEVRMEGLPDMAGKTRVKYMVDTRLVHGDLVHSDAANRILGPDLKFVITKILLFTEVLNQMHPSSRDFPGVQSRRDQLLARGIDTRVFLVVYQPHLTRQQTNDCGVYAMEHQRYASCDPAICGKDNKVGPTTRPLIDWLDKRYPDPRAAMVAHPSSVLRVLTDIVYSEQLADQDRSRVVGPFYVDPVPPASPDLVAMYNGQGRGDSMAPSRMCVGLRHKFLDMIAPNYLHTQYSFYGAFKTIEWVLTHVICPVRMFSRENIAKVQKEADAYAFYNPPSATQPSAARSYLDDAMGSPWKIVVACNTPSETSMWVDLVSTLLRNRGLGSKFAVVAFVNFSEALAAWSSYDSALSTPTSTQVANPCENVRLFINLTKVLPSEVVHGRPGSMENAHQCAIRALSEIMRHKYVTRLDPQTNQGSERLMPFSVVVGVGTNTGLPYVSSQPSSSSSYEQAGPSHRRPAASGERRWEWTTQVLSTYKPAKDLIPRHGRPGPVNKSHPYAHFFLSRQNKNCGFVTGATSAYPTYVDTYPMFVLRASFVDWNPHWLAEGRIKYEYPPN